MPSPTLDQIITEAEQWFTDTIHNSIVSREVAVFNHVHSAFDELKNRIVELFGGTPVAAATVAQPTPIAEPEATPAADKSKPAT